MYYNFTICDEKMGKELKFKLTDSLLSSQERLAREVLPNLELFWVEQTKEENLGKKLHRVFETQLGNVKITVKESGLDFSYTDHNDMEGKSVSTKTHDNKYGKDKYVKSIIHHQLCERFDADDDIMFFHKVTESLMEHLEVEIGEDGDKKDLI